MSGSENKPATSPKSLGEILEHLASPENWNSTSNESKLNSLTTTSPKEKPAPIGRPLSEHGLTALRNMAQNVQSGTLLDNKAFETLLAQHFGLSRFASKENRKCNYNSGEFDYTVEGYEIILDELHDDEMKLYDAAEFFNRPATPEFTAKQLARLSVVMARRNESNPDLAILIDTYTEHLAEYPCDIIKTICDNIIDGEKWFPLVSDMRKKAEQLMKFRRAIWETFQEKRNPLLAKKAEQKKLASDPRLQESWKNLSRKEWLSQHYDWAIGECEEMLKLALQNTQFMNPKMWEEKILEYKKLKSA